MDYGEKQYFDDSRDNLNLENWTSEHNLRNIGSGAIFSDKNNPVLDSTENDVLGQIVDIDTAAVSTSNASSDAVESKNTAGPNEQYAAIVGDHFNDRVFTEIKRAEGELSQTDNMNNFYEEIRGMASIASDKWGK